MVGQTVLPRSFWRRFSFEFHGVFPRPPLRTHPAASGFTLSRAIEWLILDGGGFGEEGEGLPVVVVAEGYDGAEGVAVAEVERLMIS